jgi:hypothetical protein
MKQVTLWVPREQAVAFGQSQTNRESKTHEERSSSKTEPRKRAASRSPDRAR